MFKCFSFKLFIMSKQEFLVSTIIQKNSNLEFTCYDKEGNTNFYYVFDKRKFTKIPFQDEKIFIENDEGKTNIYKNEERIYSARFNRKERKWI